MRKILPILLLISLVSIAYSQDATMIYKNTVASTVTIETDNSQGSGFFVGTNMIATNYHVIEGATKAICYVNGSSTQYKIEGYLALNKSADLIILKVTGLNRESIKFTTDSVFPGDKIYAIGSPKGLQATISDGIVSGLRDFDGHKLIQITAPISPGSSGGPVLNSKGELIGISVGQLKDGQNLNFAIPISYIQILKTQLLAVQPITKLKRSLAQFKSIEIGGQIWMAANLNISQFRNGDEIPEAKTEEEWQEAYDKERPAWCYYNNDKDMGEKYGKLYNWFAVIDSRGLAPEGWRIPNFQDWENLRNSFGGEWLAGEKLKSSIGWKYDDNGTNESGFNGLPGGYRKGGNRSYDARLFFFIGMYAKWWVSPKANDTETIWIFLLQHFGNNALIVPIREKVDGLNVRCIKE